MPEDTRSQIPLIAPQHPTPDRLFPTSNSDRQTQQKSIMINIDEI
ncbi:MAG: hypothetical protein ACOYMQ_14795 [Pseudanabaena sp.]